jgi:hypothetical protein
MRYAAGPLDVRLTLVLPTVFLAGRSEIVPIRNHSADSVDNSPIGWRRTDKSSMIFIDRKYCDRDCRDL